MGLPEHKFSCILCEQSYTSHRYCQLQPSANYTAGLWEERLVKNDWFSVTSDPSVWAWWQCSCWELKGCIVVFNPAPCVMISESVLLLGDSGLCLFAQGNYRCSSNNTRKLGFELFFRVFYITRLSNKTSSNATWFIASPFQDNRTVIQLFTLKVYKTQCMAR